MKILIIGKGGREHAIASTLQKSKYKPTIYVAPGNGGMSNFIQLAINELQVIDLAEFALKEGIDLTIVGPEASLEQGIVDEFIKRGLKIFGPTKAAAKIETSKEFAKKLMIKYQILTAYYRCFTSFKQAYDYLIKQPLPVVIKYDGLASGKGVVIANTIEEGEHALSDMLEKRVFGKGKVIIEEYLQGIEFSFMAFVNKDKVYPLEIAQDYKRVNDGNKGPNTGGMGAYSPVPLVSDEAIEEARINILNKTASALVKENASFTGVLYGGLMLTDKGVKVIEFNARFGDPETEVVLPRLESDLLDVILKILNDEEVELIWNHKAAVGVVMATLGYPGNLQSKEIINNSEQELIYHMGTIKIDEQIYNNGGRVLMVVGQGNTLEEARIKAYEKVMTIKHSNLFYRKDIGEQIIKGEVK